MKVLHKPTGIFRAKGPPWPKPGRARQEMLREIESELTEKGLSQYILTRGNPTR